MKMIKVTGGNGTLFCVNPQHITTLHPIINNASAQTIITLTTVEGTDNLAAEYYVQESIERILKQIEA